MGGRNGSAAMLRHGSSTFPSVTAPYPTPSVNAPATLSYVVLKQRRATTPKLPVVISIPRREIIKKALI